MIGSLTRFFVPVRLSTCSALELFDLAQTVLDISGVCLAVVTAGAVLSGFLILLFFGR